MDGYQDKDTPWRDKEKLRELYIEKEMNTVEMSEELGCSPDTAGSWLKNFGIKRKYKDQEWLYEQYIEKGLSTTEVAAKTKGNHTTVLRWLKHYDIPISRASRRPATYMSMSGENPAYVYWECGVTCKSVYVHRLLAVAEYGFDAVRDMDVHHKNEIPWDNRPCNVEPIDPSDHLKHHWHDSDYDYRKRTENRYTKT